MRKPIFIILIICVVVAATVIVYRITPEVETEQNHVVNPTEQPKTESVDTKTKGEEPKPSEVNTDKKSKTPDWWTNDPKPNETSKKSTDPWKEFKITDDLLDTEFAEDTEQRDFDISSPDSYDQLRKEMVDNYGDTPEVENYMQTWLKAVSSPDNMKYKAAFAKAAYEIYPSPETLKSMEVLNAMANNDMETLRKYAQPAEDDSRFLDVQPFFQNNSHVEAFRKLRQSNPKRSAEFEKFILEQASNDPHMDFEKISNAIEQSRQTDTR